LNYENLSGNGFGEAKTNDGKIYKVQIRDWNVSYNKKLQIS
jgi:hypothetical protein